MRNIVKAVAAFGSPSARGVADVRVSHYGRPMDGKIGRIMRGIVCRGYFVFFKVKVYKRVLYRREGKLLRCECTYIFQALPFNLISIIDAV